MAVVYVDLESTLPSWYTAAVYSAGTTYAQNDYVIAAAASGLYSGTTAVLWKSLQNANTGNALVEGVWWTVVADGSAAKPYPSVDDGTRFAAGGSEVRILKSPDDDTDTLANISVTFHSVYGTDSNKGKAVASGVDLTASLSAGMCIGNDDILYWRVASTSYAGGDTVITFDANRYFVATDLTSSRTITDTRILGTVVNTATQTCRTNNTVISGGWDPTTETQIGRTVIDRGGVNVSFATLTYNTVEITFDNLILINPGGMPYSLTSVGGVTWTRCGVLGAGNTWGSTGSGAFKFENCWAVGRGIAANYGMEIKNCRFLGPSSTYASSVSVSGGVYIADSVVIVGTNGSALQCHSGIAVIKNSFLAQSGGAALITGTTYGITSISTDRGTNTTIILDNCQLAGTFAAFTNTASKANQLFHNYDQVVGDHRIYTMFGNILADTSTVHTAGGTAWRYEPSSYADLNTPLYIQDAENVDPFQVAVAANSQVTATIWCKKSDADAGFEAQFICKGGQLAGIASDVTAVATDSTDWQQLTIQVTPSEAGVLRFGFQVWGSATATCHIDDFGVTQ